MYAATVGAVREYEGINYCGDQDSGYVLVPAGSFTAGCEEVYQTNVYACSSGGSTYLGTMRSRVTIPNCTPA